MVIHTVNTHQRLKGFQMFERVLPSGPDMSTSIMINDYHLDPDVASRTVRREITSGQMRHVSVQLDRSMILCIDNVPHDWIPSIQWLRDHDGAGWVCKRCHVSANPVQIN